MSPTNLSPIRPKTVEKLPFEVVACAIVALCGHLVAKLYVCLDVCLQILDLHKISVDLVRITHKMKNLLKTWSFTAGLSPSLIDINSVKSYILAKVFYGCSKKANQLI